MLHFIDYYRIANNNEAPLQILLEWPKFRAQIMVGLWSNRDSLFAASGDAEWLSHFGRQSGSFLQIKHTFIMQPSNNAPWYIPKRLENLRAHENLYMDVWNWFIPNCSNLETNEMSFIRGLDKKHMQHSHNGTAFHTKVKCAPKPWKDTEET
jgi:hypothetical protein